MGIELATVNVFETVRSIVGCGRWAAVFWLREEEKGGKEEEEEEEQEVVKVRFSMNL